MLDERKSVVSQHIQRVGGEIARLRAVLVHVRRLRAALCRPMTCDIPATLNHRAGQTVQKGWEGIATTYGE
jgi:hypothetical protein